MFVEEKASSNEQNEFRLQITAIHLEYSGRPPSSRTVLNHFPISLPFHYRQS
jgi:hypothetical protein